MVADAGRPAPAHLARVLLADDNEINRRLIATVLRRLGYVVETAENGHQAVDMHRAAPFDIVLMDMRMPGMDGAAATQAIRAMAGPNARVPVVALTADATFGHLADDPEAGLDAVIAKPVDWRRLDAVIRRLTGCRQHPGAP